MTPAMFMLAGLGCVSWAEAAESGVMGLGMSLISSLQGPQLLYGCRHAALLEDLLQTLQPAA